MNCGKCGVWFIWGSLGSAENCARSLLMSARALWKMKEYRSMAGCPSLCILVLMEGKEYSSF